MDILTTVLLLLICLLLSNIIGHYTPFIPTALVQIGLGVLVVFLFDDIAFEIETEWFLLLFIAPLLYNDGRHYPRQELWKLRGPILGNAVLLVLITTVAGGYFIHWLIDEIPLTAAFALAAILSPTDPVAVNGIAKRIHIPRKVLNIVRGESLINDASGLVAFNYAVAAVLTGYFSLREAIFDFSFKFIAGALIGIVLGFMITKIRYELRKRNITDVTFHSLVQILTPFIIFFITEELLHASGVIAVVAAGIVHSLIRERIETLIAEEQVLTENIWSIILFILNGIVFLLLGLSIPTSMQGVLENPNAGIWLIVGYVAAITFVILAIRFIWGWLFTSYEYRFRNKGNLDKPDLKTTLFVCLTGVRGTVTMVGVLSIPYAIDNGEDFPNRSLILFLAAGVILFTLLIATICLPLLSKGKEGLPQAAGTMDMKEARRKIYDVSVDKIKSEMTDDNEFAVFELIQEYKIRFLQTVSEGTAAMKIPKKAQRHAQELRLAALRIERKAVEEAIKQHDGIDNTELTTFIKSLDYREKALANRIHTRVLYMQSKIMQSWEQFRFNYLDTDEAALKKSRWKKDIQAKGMQAAVSYLKAQKEQHEQPELIDQVIAEYQLMIGKLKRPLTADIDQREQQKGEMRIRAMDTGRNEIHMMYDKGEISREQAKELRRFLNYIESVTLFEYEE